MVFVCYLVLLGMFGWNIIAKKQHNPQENFLNHKGGPIYDALIAADEVFKRDYKPQPNMFPPRRAAIITCMDYRLNDFLSSVAFGTYILRNAGGRVTEDWIRSLVILYKLLGINEIFLIQHSDCGMQKFSDIVMQELLEESCSKATLVNNCNLKIEQVQDSSVCKWENATMCCGKKVDIDYQRIDWRTIKDGLFASVLEDVTKLRNHPLIPVNIPIYGFIFDVMTGDLIPVPKAMRVGKAKELGCK